MQPYSYVAYPNPNGATMPIRYMVPPNYRQNSPPFVNQSFDRYARMPPPGHPVQYAPQPLRYPSEAVPPGYRPEYPAPGLPPYPMSTMMPIMPPPRPQQQQQSQQLQYPQAYYYNPNGYNGLYPVVSSDPKTSTTVPKKDAKEYKDNAFTISPDGARNEAVKGLVSNNNINDLLKHKSTKDKVSKIYRNKKPKPDTQGNDFGGDEFEQAPLDSVRPRIIKQSSVQIQRPPPPQIQRVPSALSIYSYCSTCSTCSCSEYRSQKRGLVYDDCPECRAEWEREQARRPRHK